MAHWNLELNGRFRNFEKQGAIAWYTAIYVGMEAFRNFEK